MAVNTTADKVKESEFLGRGFTRRHMEGVEYWIIERTGDDGSPWDTSLY